MIKITQHNDKWCIEIGFKDEQGEKFQFNDFESMRIALDQLLIIKSKFGKLSQ